MRLLHSIGLVLSTVSFFSAVSCSDSGESSLKAEPIDFSIRVPREVEGSYGIKIKMAPSDNPFPSIIYKTATLKQIEGDRYLMTEWNCRADVGSDARQALTLSETALQSIPPLTFEVRAWKNAEDVIFIEAKDVANSIQSTANLTANVRGGAFAYAKTSLMDYNIERSGEATFFGTIKESSHYSVNGDVSEELKASLLQSMKNEGTLEMLRFDDDPACETMFWDNTFAK
jgi:hypothetical protein